MKLGNPAPLGLLAFGMTTMNLMYAELGWCENDFEVSVAGTAMAFGGLCQLLTAIFEMRAGNSYAFAVFGSYGAFWVGWSIVFIEQHRTTSTFGEASFQDGKTLWLAQWGVLTACFAAIALRKNAATLTVLSLLSATFFLLSVNSAQHLQATKRAAGYVGFATAIAAWYTAVAELINEEWGRHVLPGLDPFYKPQRIAIDKEAIKNHLGYDRLTNTLFLQFRGLQFTEKKHIYAVEDAITETIMDVGAPGNRCHIVADYEDTVIADDIRREYWAMAAHLQRNYYLSATRFHISSFGTKTHIAPMVGFGGVRDASSGYHPHSRVYPIAIDEETTGSHGDSQKHNEEHGDKNV